MRITLTLTLAALAFTAGCTDSTDKQDASAPRFDVSDDAKADSPRTPIKGGDLKVSELEEWSFSRTRGYIGYDIQLEQGRVDIDLTGADGLDTILYVFGPKRANGHYPAQVLAFNDDYEPGVNLGSHIVLDVPTAGMYRLVASTYDNYINYPRNVTVADYRLIVRCQSPTFGACGPAVSPVGGTCWADEDCLAADGQPLHCEGEVTCAPGTQCLFVREGACVEDYAWMTYAAVQCGSPWSQVELTDEEATRFPSAELAQVVKFYGQQGIAFDEIGTLAAPEPMVTCSACGCPRGTQVAIKVKTPAAAVLGGLGWIYSASDPAAMSLAPAQCGANPWQTAPTSDLTAELEQVDTWIAGMGASVTKRGFAWSVEPQLVCAACSCPRGDRLLAFPVDQEDHGLLSSSGFADIYVP
ncbi:MAG: hypothetical protein H0T79_18610 [Deltaproteobacteria bacterium]|nr:hypothetical protein [Deltaproteobacteria bacterium]